MNSNSNDKDRELVDFVDREIKSGKSQVTVPSSMIRGTSRDAREDIRDNCKLNDVELDIEID
jgi:hypothetical protein